MIYLDNQATTKMDQLVLEEMIPYFSKIYGNTASKTHKFGWDAEEAIEKAREKIAKTINAYPHEIFFTSGATESNNTIIKNFSDNNIIISQIEHSSVEEPSFNFCNIFHSNIDKYGIVDLEFFNYLLLTTKPSLVSIMMVNNEIGTIQPIKELKKIAKNTLFHSDITQAIGKIKIDIKDLNIDFASFSAHKIYGPKGIGALYIRDGVNISPLLYGGGHERRIRSGTLNVPAIVGFGKTCEIINFDSNIKKLHDILKTELEKIPEINIHNFTNKIYHNLHLSVNCDMDLFMSKLSENVAISFGSACMSHDNKPSRVLKSLNYSDNEIKKSIRISLGKFNTESEMYLVSDFFKKAIKFAKGETL